MAEANWYVDKADPTLARWHDGTGWTDYVLVRAEWEGGAEPPPPPDELVWDLPRPGRLRWVAGSAAAVVLLLIGAVALLQDGDDGGPVDGTTTGQNGPDEDTSTADDLFRDGAGLGSDADDPGDAPTAGESDDATVDGTVARSRAPGTTSGAGGPSAVERTETITRTQTNPGPRTSIGPRDETNVGNSTATSISYTYTPPPTTVAPSTTVADTTPTTAAPATTAPPTDGGTDGPTTG